MRNFLRLDFLYQQAVHHHTKADPWSTRAAVSSLLEILAITQRGDVRGEVLKELERQMGSSRRSTRVPAWIRPGCAHCSPSCTACARN